MTQDAALLDRRLSVAPMMDWTNKHCRAFHRTASKHTLLYTEMVTTGAVLFGDRDRILGYNTCEHPVACQLGGSDPKELRQAAVIIENMGYDEINLNVGCPSDRVQSGFFGACLMAKPELVADCIDAMQGAVSIPVTVKSRIGIDDMESYDHLTNFIATVGKTGCRHFIVHARKAILSGLSPKQNREIPPLKYDFVYQLKKDFADYEIAINGGILSLEEALIHLQKVDGVMIGRAAYTSPALLLGADRCIFQDTSVDQDQSPHALVRVFLPYIDDQLSRDVPLHAVTRHMLGLFNGQPGARAWRRYLSENAYAKNAGTSVVEQALAFVPEQARSLESTG